MYTIKMEPEPGNKRRAQNQLTEDNQYDQSDDTQAGVMQKADLDVLRRRRIITPRGQRPRTQQQPRQPRSPKRSPQQQGVSFVDNRRVKRIKRNNNPRLIRNILKNLQHEAKPQPQAQIQQNQLEL